MSNDKKTGTSSTLARVVAGLGAVLGIVSVNVQAQEAPGNTTVTTGIQKDKMASVTTGVQKDKMASVVTTDVKDKVHMSAITTINKEVP